MSPDPLPEGTHARETHAGALRDAVELVRQERRVGRDHDDDRAGVRSPACAFVGSSESYRHARDAKRQSARRSSPAPARPTVYGAIDLERRDAVPMPHLNMWQIMPVPPPTIALVDRPPFAPSIAANTCSGLHVEAVDVVQLAVPGLGDDRRRPPVAGSVRVAVLHAPGDRRLVHRADAVRVREHHRAVEHPGLLDPGAARHLARAVQHEANLRTRAS
jgi:hypothetical protein